MGEVRRHHHWRRRAGLAAARELSGAGKRVCMVEARERAGGRIHTVHMPDLPVPIELGAEFIHGDAHDTFSIVEAAALTACELPDDHWWSNEGTLEEIPQFWERIDRVRAQIGSLRKDRSFADFIRSRRSMPSRLRLLATMFVEGYHAAHADRISALALRTADEEQEQAGGNKQFRILNGQDALIEWLRAGLDPSRVDLRFGTTVTAVHWRDRSVAVEARSTIGRRELTLHAASAIVTIPIGVWKAAQDHDGAIRFDPPLVEKAKAIERLEVGHVVKITFRFAERFWGEVNFVHSPDRFIPTWWTAAPVRGAILVGWAGGHAADALLAEGASALTDRALDSMAKAFAVRRGRIDDLLAGSFTHDWQSDPFARGAYSYAGVGGTGAHQALAKPLRSTLFFAGEATSSAQTGTVAGAIESGKRASAQVLRALR